MGILEDAAKQNSTTQPQVTPATPTQPSTPSAPQGGSILEQAAAAQGQQPPASTVPPTPETESLTDRWAREAEDTLRAGYHGLTGEIETEGERGKRTTTSPESAYLGFTPQNVAYNFGDMLKGMKDFGLDAFHDLVSSKTPVIIPDEKNVSWADPQAKTLLAKYVSAPAEAERQKAQDEAVRYINSTGWEAAGHLLGYGVHQVGEAVPMVGPFLASIVEQARKGDVGGALAKVAALKAAEKTIESVSEANRKLRGAMTPEERAALGGKPTPRTETYSPAQGGEGPRTSTQTGTVAGEKTKLRPTTRTTAGVEAPVTAKASATLEGEQPSILNRAAGALTTPTAETRFGKEETAPAAQRQAQSTIGQVAEDKIAQHLAVVNGEEAPEAIAGTQQVSKFTAPDEAWQEMQNTAKATTLKTADAISQREQAEWEAKRDEAVNDYRESVERHNKNIDDYNAQAKPAERMQHVEFDPEDALVPERPQSYNELRSEVQRQEALASRQNPDAASREEAINKGLPKAEKAMDGWFKQHSDEISPAEYDSFKKLWADSERFKEIANGLRPSLLKGDLTGNKMRNVEAAMNTRQIRKGQAPEAFARLLGPDGYNNWHNVAKLFDTVKDPTLPEMFKSWGQYASEYLLSALLPHLGLGPAVKWTTEKLLNHVMFDPEFGSTFGKVVDWLKGRGGLAAQSITELPANLRDRLVNIVKSYQASKTSSEKGMAGADINKPRFGRKGLGGPAEPTSEDVQAASAPERDTNILGQVQRDMPNASLSEQLMEAARRANPKPAAKNAAAASADEYNQKLGRPPITEVMPQATPNGRELADAYDKMKHNPNDPNVQRAYTAMKDEIDDQWEHAVQSGFKFEPWTKEGQPYANSREMMQDVKNNHHLFFFTGGDLAADHPLAETDPKTGLTYNEKLRAVHDLYGHAAGGFEFGPKGEEAAYQTHAQMFSPEALPALTTETRGQNNWVNQGPHMRNAEGQIIQKGEPGYLAPTERPFAENKAALLPEKFLAEHPVIEAIKSGEPFAILQAENPQNTRVSEAKNAELTETLRRELISRGYKPVAVGGNTRDVAGVTEHAFFVPGMDTTEALDLGKKYNQQGILTHDGLHDLNSGTTVPIDRTGKILTGDEARKQQYFTTVGSTDFHVPLKAPETFEAHHWSSVPNLTETNPEMMGTGVRGAERARMGEPGFLKRTNFGTEGYKEPAVQGKPYRYVANLDKSKYYDAQNDPEGIWQKGFQEGGATGAEKAVRDAGYHGYRIGNEVASFEKVAVQPERRAERRAPMSATELEEAIKNRKPVQTPFDVTEGAMATINHDIDQRLQPPVELPKPEYKNTGNGFYEVKTGDSGYLLAKDVAPEENSTEPSTEVQIASHRVAPEMRGKGIGAGQIEELAKSLPRTKTAILSDTSMTDSAVGSWKRLQSAYPLAVSEQPNGQWKFDLEKFRAPATTRTTVVPKGSTVELMHNPLPVKATGEDGPTTIDVAKALNKYTKRNLGALKPGSEPTEMVDRAKSIAEDEARYQLGQNNSGTTWYTEQMDEHDRIAKEMRPALNDDTKLSLFKMAEAILSAGQKPYRNFTATMEAFDHYVKNGKFSGTNPENRMSWGPRGIKAYASAFDSLNSLIDEKGEKGAVDWLMSEHPVAELREYNKWVRGKKSDTQPGVMILGPKRGPFAQNLHGLESSFTADMWVSRTWNRWMGTIEIDPESGEITSDLPRNQQERSLMRQAFEETAQKLGLTTSSLQAVLWYYEQALYTAHGTPKESWSFSDAAARAQAEERARAPQPAPEETPRKREGRYRDKGTEFNPEEF